MEVEVYPDVEFDNAKNAYENALAASGLESQLKFNKPVPKRRPRRRKITYFNPPYNAAVTTNIGKEFINLIDKHFPRHHKYHKIFNRNTIKVSYSCTSNMKTIISNHNKSLLNKSENETAKICNCRDVCPLPNHGDCRRSAVVYKATVTSQNTTKCYIGSAETEIKLRLANHKHSLNDVKLRNATRLSAYIHTLKENNRPYEIKWNLEAKSKPYTCGTRKCNLCLTEKLHILRSDPATTLNSRTEFASKCRHSSKFKLRNVR